METGSTISSLRAAPTAPAKAVSQGVGRDKLDSTKESDASGDGAKSRSAATKELTPEQLQQVAELRQTDLKVRQHEQAHLSAGRGVVTSGPNYTYTYGPDGKQYAVGGEVGIDTSAERDPQANIDKGQQIQAAALAPSEPSPQDYRVAAVGAELASTGRSDLAVQQSEQRAEAAAKEAAARDNESVPQPAQSAQSEQSGQTLTVASDSSDSTKNELVRKQIVSAYQPAAQAAGELSVFA